MNLFPMDKYKEYYLDIEPLGAQKKNRLIFKKPITWRAEGRNMTMETWETVLTLDLAPLQQELVMKALSLFRDPTQGKKEKSKKPKPLDEILGTTNKLERLEPEEAI